MKKLYIYILLILTASQAIANNNSKNDEMFTLLTIGTIPSSICANESFQVPYTASGFVLPTNIFKVEMSNAAGSFLVPTVIGATVSNTSGFIEVTIPDGTSGTGHLIRIHSSETGGYSNNTPNLNVTCTTRDYYWIGGTGSWSQTSHWKYTTNSGATWTEPATEPPTTYDNVIFDTQSFPTGGTLSFDQWIDINDFIWETGSGANNPVIQANWNGMNIGGDFILDAGVLISLSDIDFSSSKENITVNFGDNTRISEDKGSINFYYGGSWQIFSEITAYSIQIRDGSTVNTNSNQINLDGYIWADGNWNTLNTGTSQIYLGDLTSNDMTITGNATWHFTNENTYTQTIGRNLTLGNVIIEKGSYRLNGNNYFENLEIKPSGGIVLEDYSSTQIGSSFTAIGTRNELVTIESQNTDIQATLTILTGASVTVEFASIQDNNIVGPATPYLADNSVNNGNNAGWTFIELSPLDYYWVGGTGNWSDNAAHWAKQDGGGGFRESPPGAIDNVYFTTASFPSGGALIIDGQVTCNIMEWQPGSGANNPSIQAEWGNSLTVNGDFWLDDGVQRNLSEIFFVTKPGQTQVVYFGDNLFNRNDLVFQGGGTWSLMSNMKADRIELRDGTFNTSGHQVDAERIYFYENNSSNWTNSIVNISSGIYDYTYGGKTFNAGSSTFNFVPPYPNWSVSLLGPFVLNNAVFSGQVNMTGDNSFNGDLTFHSGSVVSLKAGSTQTVVGSFIATGLRDQPINIMGDGGLATISQVFGTSNTEYLAIQDVQATGGATFNTNYSTYNGVAYSGGTTVSGWKFNTALESYDLYWVNGSGNWSDFANNWSLSDGNSSGVMATFAPGPIDNVFFTSNSFGAAGQVVTLDNPIEIKNMTWETGSGTQEPAIAGDWSNSLTVHGSLTMDNGVKRNLQKIIFDSPDASIPINFADNAGGTDYTSIDFRGGGAWELQSTLKTWYLNIEDGMLHTSSQELHTHEITLHSPTSGINLYGSNVYMTGLRDYSGGTAAFLPGSSTIFVTDDGTSFTTEHSLNDVVVTEQGSFYVEGNFSVNNLTLEPGADLTIGPDITLTTKSINAIGTSGKPIRIQSSESGMQGNIVQASGSVNGQFLLISDNNASGGALFNANNSFDAGNVSGWILTVPIPAEYYWIGGTGSWSEVNHWSTTSGGSPDHTSPPGVTDNVYFTPQSFTGSGQTVSLDQPAFCNNMTWSTTADQAPILSGPFDTPLKVYGHFILANGVQRNVAELLFESFGTDNNINMADNLHGSFARTVFNGTGSFTLLNDLKAESIRLRGGAFNTNDFDLHVGQIRFSPESELTFNAGSSNIYTSDLSNNSWGGGFTFNKGTSTVHMIKTTGSVDGGEEGYINGPFNFNNLIIDFSTRIWGSNSYSSLTVSPGITLELSSNDIQLVSNLMLEGEAGNPVMLQSTYDGIQGTFSVPSTGSVYANYVIIKDNAATGGADFTATNSSDVGNVTGWNGLKTGQTISFPALDDVNNDPGTIALNATSTSGLEVTYTVTPITGTGTVSSNSFTASSVGLVAITAHQNGDATYGAAQSITQYVHINEGTFPNELGQMKQASYVVGAPNGAVAGDRESFTDRTVSYGFHGIVSPDGKLIIGGMGRVMIWNSLPDAFDIPADVVVGQLDFTSLSQTASRNTLGFPTSDMITGDVAVSPDGKLIVSDGRGVLIWNTIPTENGVPADVIIGQTNFTSTDMAATQDKFMTPFGVAVSNDNKLIVSDILGNRVLIYNSIPTTNGALADVVIGQPDFTSSSSGISDKSMSLPALVSVTPDNKLLIAELANNRVLVYNSIPTTDHAAADMVIGQPDFNSNSAGTSATSLSFPASAAVSKSGKLAIGDWLNRRVLIYDELPANSTTPADMVLGQPDFESNDLDLDNINLRVMGAPFGVAWDNTENLIITDGIWGLSRVMVYGAKDLEPPVITNTTLLSPHYTKGGASQVSQITLTDRSGIKIGRVHFQEISAYDPIGPSYEVAELTQVYSDGSIYNYEFDLSIIETINSNPVGIQYYVDFEDNAGNILTTEDRHVLPVNYPDGIPINTYGVGSTTEDYRLMAIPLDLSNSAVDQVFSDIYGGAFHKGKMRIFSYAGGTTTDYIEASGSTNLEVGKGYFALAVTGSPTSITTPSGTTYFETTNGLDGIEKIHEFKIDLVNGWNLIGNPFIYDIPWSNIELLSEITSNEVDNLQKYDGTGYTSITSIPAGEGAFVLNNTGSVFTLRIPAYKNYHGGRINEKQENKNPLSELSWEVLLKAKHGNQEVTLGGFGMEEDAEFSKDQYDLVNPPAFGSMKQISFNHPEFIASSFKKDIRESNFEETWKFYYKVEDSDNSKHELIWDNNYFGDISPDLYLVDKTHFQVINMKEMSSYEFNHGGLTQFEIYFGDNALEALMPDQIEVQTPYPNPFTDKININVGLPDAKKEHKVVVGIYNTLGKQVAILDSNLNESGYYVFSWPGTNDAGQEVPDGMYAYRVIISGNAEEIVSGKIVKE
ncbi:MAG: FlgD immunoglobulin-like domain containing protein [Bacteroidota bacterium]